MSRLGLEIAETDRSAGKGQKWNEESLSIENVGPCTGIVEDYRDHRSLGLLSISPGRSK